MEFSFFIATIISINTFHFFSSFWENLSTIGQNICQSALPKTSENFELLNALVCGGKITQVETMNLLVASQLVHIYIVSGSHFRALEQIFRFLKMKDSLVIALLSIFAALSGFQAPGVRSLIQILFPMFISRSSFWRSDQRVLFAGILTLLLRPDWISSKSLIMSWSCSLVFAVILPEELPEYVSSCLHWFMLQVLLMPSVWGMASLHPIALFTHLLITPLIGGILFPLAMIAIALPGIFLPVFDFANSMLFTFLRTITPIQIQTQSVMPLPLSILWFCLLLSHFIIGLFNRTKLRQKFAS